MNMNCYDLLVLNGLVVTASDIGHYDIAIKDEKISLLAPRGSLADVQTDRIIDAEGGYVMVRGASFFIADLTRSCESLEVSTPTFISKNHPYLEKAEVQIRMRLVIMNLSNSFSFVDSWNKKEQDLLSAAALPL